MEIKQIGEIYFKGENVKIYYHPSNSINTIFIASRVRNPESFYQGIVYRNIETGEITYPEGVIIPEQTEHDREVIPTSVIIGQEDLTDELKEKINKILHEKF